MMSQVLSARVSRPSVATNAFKKASKAASGTTRSGGKGYRTYDG